MGQAQGRIPRAIGSWRDLEIRDHRYHHPIAFVDAEWNLEERRLVAEHLRSGKRVMSCMGYSWCRFHCGVDDAEMGDSDFSDGLWLWPEGLAHYVLEHAVRLPEEFLEHVRRQAENPGRAHQSAEDSDVVDFDFWIAWSNEHANPASGYAELEKSEREAVLRRRLAEVPELEAEFGIGT